MQIERAVLCIWLLSSVLACGLTHEAGDAQPMQSPGNTHVAPAPVTTAGAMAPAMAPAHEGGAGAAGSGDPGGAATAGSTATAVDDPQSDPAQSDPVQSDPAPSDPTPTAPSIEPSSADAPCLDGIANYAEPGPFTFTATRSGMVNLWVPAVAAGCKVPVVHFANGTGASCSSYTAILERLASHGFLVSCYENTLTAFGTQCLTAFDTAVTEYPELADETRIGFAGHEIGGSGALLCAYNAEQKWSAAKLYAVYAMGPHSGSGSGPDNWPALYGQIASPTFMFKGSEDTLLPESWVQQTFDAMNPSAEVYWYTGLGAPGLPIPTSWAQTSIVPWFRWKLLGDKQACEFLKALPDGDQWDLHSAQNESGC